jgi:hypothetical protein
VLPIGENDNPRLNHLSLTRLNWWVVADWCLGLALVALLIGLTGADAFNIVGVGLLLIGLVLPIAAPTLNRIGLHARLRLVDWRGRRTRRANDRLRKAVAEREAELARLIREQGIGRLEANHPCADGRLETSPTCADGRLEAAPPDDDGRDAHATETAPPVTADQLRYAPPCCVSELPPQGEKERLGGGGAVAVKTTGFPVVLAVFAIGLLASIASVPGCTSQTVVTPGGAKVGHETRVENAGWTRTATLTVTPGATALAGTQTPSGLEDSAQRLAESSPAGSGGGESGSASRATTTPTTLTGVAALAAARGMGVTLTTSETKPTTADETRSTIDETGAGLRSSSSEAAIDFDSSGRTFPLPWGGVLSGGISGLTATISGKKINALHLFGAVTLLAAVVPIVVKPRRIGLAAAIAGAGLVLIATGTVVAKYPLALLVGLGVFAGVLAWLAVSAWRARQNAVAIERVAKGVEDLPEPQKLAVKASIARAANGSMKTVRAVVRRAKRRLGTDGRLEAAPPVGILGVDQTSLRGGAVAARWAHNPEAAGSSPAPAIANGTEEHRLKTGATAEVASGG